MEEIWVTLTPKIGESDSTCLEKWYYEQEGAYASFEFVKIVNIRNEFPKQKNEDPYLHFLFLFYESKPMFNELLVYGSCDWNHLDKQPRCLEHSISFFPPFDNTSVMDCDEEEEDDNSNETLPPILPFDKKAENDVSLETCQQHAFNYLLRKTEPTKLTQNTVLMFTGLVGCLISDPDNMTEYCNARLQFEITTTRRLLTDASEKKVLKLFFNSGIEEYLKEAMIVAPSLNDKQYFYRRYGNEIAPPQVCFCVPIEELSHDITRHMPLYKHGLAHMTYKEVCNWVCNLITIQSKTLYSRKHDIQDERIQYTAKMINNLFGRHLVVATQTNTRSVKLITQSWNNLEETELLKCVPACFRKIMLAKRFPKNMERLFLLSTMRAAGVSMETFGNWLTKKNEQYPKEGGCSVEARFNYKYEWNRINSVSEISCKTIIQNTRSNQIDKIQCPFYSTNPQVKDIEDVDSYCKNQCMPNETVPFSGPKNVMKRLYFRK